MVTPRNDTPQAAPSQPLGIQDILVMLYRHKGKITIFTLIGLVAAGAVFFTAPRPHEARASLLVRYILERSAIDDVEANHAPTRGSRYSADVIDAEVAILRSQNIARDVVEKLGVEKVFGENAEGKTVSEAVGAVTSGLEVDSVDGSNIIWVSYRNEDATAASEVLNELVAVYFRKHLDIHRSKGAQEFVQEQTEVVKGRLSSAEAELNRLKSDANIVSLEESTTSLSAQLAKVRDDLMSSQAELEAQRARVSAIEQQIGAAPSGAGGAADQEEEPVGGATGEPAVPAPGDGATAVAAAGAQPGPQVVQEYRNQVVLIDLLNRRKLDYLTRFTEQSSSVRMIQKQLDDAEAKRQAMAEQYPSLAAASPVATGGGSGPAVDLISERAILAATEARIRALEGQKIILEEEAKMLAQTGSRIAGLERRQKIEEEKVRYFEEVLDKARVDEALDPSKIPNISVVQTPFLVGRVLDDDVKKTAAMLAGGGVALGLGLALLLELFVDRRVKTVKDLTRLRIPVMMAIPDASAKALKNGSAAPAGKMLELTNGDGGGPAGGGGGALVPVEGEAAGDVVVSPWEEGHFIRKYCDGIRDRLGCYFELNRMAHKPKMVALAGINEGSGASTLAAGLAAAFSETGEGKVLLVDMNPRNHTEIHPFFAGKPVCSLSEALQSGQSVDMRFKAADKYLFLATAASRDTGGSSKQFIPKKLYDMMPQFKISDFDYIIFDMPPIGPTSPTVAMAGFMDKLLLVVDGETSDRNTLRRSYDELVANQADVSCIFNRAPDDAPGWLQLPS